MSALRQAWLFEVWRQIVAKCLSCVQLWCCLDVVEKWLVHFAVNCWYWGKPPRTTFVAAIILLCVSLRISRIVPHCFMTEYQKGWLFIMCSCLGLLSCMLPVLCSFVSISRVTGCRIIETVLDGTWLNSTCQLFLLLWRRRRLRRRLIACIARCGGAALAGQWSACWWLCSSLALWYSSFCLPPTCCLFAVEMTRRQCPQRRLQVIVENCSPHSVLWTDHLWCLLHNLLFGQTAFACYCWSLMCVFVIFHLF